MAPAKIMIIRHAEKPPKDGTAQGVDRAGTANEHALIVRGWERAGALARFFSPRSGSPPAPLVTPAFLFAPGVGPQNRSKRSKHTLGPLAELRGLQINQAFTLGGEKELAAEIMKKDGPVLIAWEHHRIVTILEHLTEGTHPAPYWPGERFDMVIVLERLQIWHLTQVPQLLLAGDSEAHLPDTKPVGSGEDE